jgi:hypothetical protein
MRVTTPIADLDITIASLRVVDGALVMENAPTDAMPTRAVLDPRDVRLVFRAVLRPSVIWFALTSAFRPQEPAKSPARAAAEDHPTANPW